jgi:hypothetical protein
MKKVLLLAAILLAFPGTGLANSSPSASFHNSKTAPHAVGTNVVDSAGTVYLIAAKNLRRPYSSAGAFLSYGFNSYASVVPANTADLNMPVGSFILPNDGKNYASSSGPDQGVVYLMSNSQKLPYTGANVFTGLGFSFANVTSANLSFVPAGPPLANPAGSHPKGVLINKNGEVFYMGNTGYYGIPDLAIFNSWGFKFSDVVPATAGDSAFQEIGVIKSRQSGELMPQVQ